MARRARGMSFVIAGALAALSLGIAGATSQPDQPRRAQSAGEDVRIYPIQHADAIELASILQQLAGAGRSVSVDQRTNSIIAFGNEALQDQIQDLIARLDVEIEQNDDKAVVRAIQLAHARADSQMAALLSEIIRSRGQDDLRVATDQSTNQLIVRGSSQTMDDVVALIEALDRPRRGEEEAERDLSFRLVWLVSASHASGPVPDDMGEVVAALEEIGISDLAVAAQSVVRATDGMPFTTRCSAELESVWDVSIAGRARHAQSGRMRIELEVEAAERREPFQPVQQGQTIQPAALQEPEHITLATTITTTDGHFVVLGAAPVKDMKSVFVIQAENIE